MNANHKLLDTLYQLGKEEKPVERLYARMLDEDLFIAAYVKLYSNKGAMTKGTDPQDSIDGMSLKRIRKIIQLLKDNEWEWQPVRRTHVPKPNGKKRPLGIPNWSNKLVQEVMRMVLEAYYEPQFLDESHGFRPHRSCHSALTQIKKTWTGVVWFVEGDIKGCFDNIDHTLLLETVGKRIRDFRFLKLLRTMLKAGYMQDGIRYQSLSGTPQGGIVSPLLANIFLHELDTYVVETLKPAFDKGTRRQINKTYEQLNNKTHYAKRRGNREAAREYERLRKQHPRSDPFDPNFRRLLYIRYADDFLIGVIGNKAEADNIKQMVANHLTDMKLTLSDTKTIITNASHEKANFLGYEIYQAQDIDHRRTNGRVQLSVPKDRITSILRRYTAKGKPKSRTVLVDYEVEEIFRLYDIELRGYYNYYQLAHNVSNRLSKLQYVMHQSLLRTLSHKLKRSTAKLWKQYAEVGPRSGRKCIGVWIETDKGQRLVTFGDLNLKVNLDGTGKDRDPYIPMLYHRELTLRLKRHSCELCGTETSELEVHHVSRLNKIRKQVRDGKAPTWKLMIASRNRKTLVVCRPCHLKIHGN